MLEGEEAASAALCSESGQMVIGVARTPVSGWKRHYGQPPWPQRPAMRATSGRR